MPTLISFMIDSSAEAVGIDTNQDIPRDELDIFFRNERAFLPPGKDFSDLTIEELREVQNCYRWDCYKPGGYQLISGLSGSV